MLRFLLNCTSKRGKTQCLSPFPIAYSSANAASAAFCSSVTEMVHTGGAASTSTVASSAASGSAAASAAETAAGDLDYIKEKGKMVIGYTVYEPMNYTDADGNFTGFDTELATAVCEKLGVEPEFVEINWDTKVVELDAKSIDCIWNGMTLTDDIMANTATTKAYAKNAQVVVVKRPVPPVRVPFRTTRTCLRPITSPRACRPTA